MSRISILSPEGQQEFVLEAHNTLGRHPHNTVQILDRIVSKEHCHIDLVDGSFVLKDLGSLNGTYVNGERVQTRVLEPGDEITLGSTRVVFHGGVASRPSSGRPAPVSPSGPPVVRTFEAKPSEPARPNHESRPPAAPPSPPGAVHSRPPAAPPPVVASPPHAPSTAAAPSAAKLGQPNSRVTIAPGMIESYIRTKLAPLSDQKFLPEKLVFDVDALRGDYEKLRVSYELARAIGVELDVDKLLAKILDCAFQLLPADRGVVLLFDPKKELKPRCMRTRRGADAGEDMVLSTTIINEVLRDKAAVLSSDASVDARFQGAHSIIMQGIRSSMAVPLLHSGELFGIMLLDSQIAANAFTEKDLQLFQNVANQAAVSIQNSLYAKKLEEEAITRERFQRLLSPAIAEQVLNGNVEVKKGGELRDTTILFSDIRGFTAMSESRNPQKIVDMLNEYFERMVEIIFKYEGTLDKFVGDEIMALFGSPVSHVDDPRRAVKTALEMLESLAEFNQTFRAHGEEPLAIGIGINSGEVVAGYLGSSKALEYTVIGDTVNTGARLCSIAKPGEIIISEHTYARVRDYFEVIELPATQVKGKARPLKIYNVIGEKSSGFGQEWTRPR